MKIAFVHSHYENLGIEYLSSCLKGAGHETALIYEPALFDSFFLTSKQLSRFFSFKKAILHRLRKEKPDLVAFSVISDDYPWVRDMAKAIKTFLKLPVLLGGIHPTAVPEYIMEDGCADYILRGEAEEAILELAAALENDKDISHIKNLCFKKEGRVIINPLRPAIENLDAIPLPDKDLFFNEYPDLVRQSYMMIASRGCRNSCSYCVNNFQNRIYPGQSYFRRRSVENAIKELEWARKRYDIRSVTFYDEVFTSDKAWLMDFLPEYKKRVARPFFCCLYPTEIDASMVKALADAGCSAVNIGIQTFSPDIRRRILNRHGSNEEIARINTLLKDNGLFIYANIMLGLPGQTQDELLKTWSFCNELKPDIPSIYWLRYYPKTQIIDIAREHGVLSHEKIEKINRGEESAPYAIRGSTFEKMFARIGNGILLSGILPGPVVTWMIRHRLYRFLPSRNMLFPAIIFTALRKKFVEKKAKTFHYLDLADYMKYYLFYIRRHARFLLFTHKKEMPL